MTAGSEEKIIVASEGKIDREKLIQIKVIYFGIGKDNSLESWKKCG